MADNFFKDNADLQYYFEKGIDWAPLVEAVERGRFGQEDGFKDVEEAVAFYRDVAEMFGEWVAKEVAPHTAAFDQEGSTYADGSVEMGKAALRVFRKLKGLDIFGLVMPREMGGMNAPMTLYFLLGEIFARADAGLMTHFGFHAGMTVAFLYYSIHEGSTRFDPETQEVIDCRFAEEIGQIIQGKAWASMDLTEANAGSDLGQVRTKGEQDADGNWTVTGQKIFISSGHARYHFVLARTEDKEGLKGLSLFMVEAFKPKRGKAKEYFATFERIEEKLGHHSSATVAISYDQTPAQLVGARGEGFKLMLLIMNNARVSVSFESLGIMESARRMAAEYAADRPSMGKTVDKHEMIADYLDTMNTEAQGLRAMAVYCAVQEELGQRYTISAKFHEGRDDAECKRLLRLARKHQANSRRVTPLIKYYGGEKSVQHAQMGIQIHGGVGYTQEYGAEKLLRDAMVLPIYEGTSQIQALMAMKDTLSGIMGDPTAFLARVAQAKWRAVSARDGLERRVEKIKTISLSAQQYLMQRTATDKIKALGGKPISSWPTAIMKDWDPKHDFAYAMLHAEHLVKLLVEESVAVLLFKQAQAHPERRELLERWLERAEPHARYLSDLIHHTGDRLLGTLREEG
jgi:hypothetical protein